VSDTHIASRAAALALEGLALDPRSVFRAVAHWSQAQRKRHRLVCPTCDGIVPNAHDLARYCSPQCARRAAYLRKRDRRDTVRALLRGELEPLSPHPMRQTGASRRTHRR
jgi:hypothetical protein